MPGARAVAHAPVMTMTDTITIPVPVRRAKSHDREIAGAVLTASFFDDPVTEWIVADLDDRAAISPPMFELYFEAFEPHGETYLAADDAGVALWLPPSTELVAPDQLEAFGARTEAVLGPYAGRLFELDEFFAAHAPEEPHWHLQLLGTLPSRQGQGIGSALLRAQLMELDARGQSAYLEATTLRNRALYERHDFRFIGEITLPDGPTLYQMWRSPR